MSATDDLRVHAAASFAAPSAIKGEDVWVEVRELRAENARLTREVERLTLAVERVFGDRREADKIAAECLSVMPHLCHTARTKAGGPGS